MTDCVFSAMFGYYLGAMSLTLFFAEHVHLASMFFDPAYK